MLAASDFRKIIRFMHLPLNILSRTLEENDKIFQVSRKLLPALSSNLMIHTIPLNSVT